MQKNFYQWLRQHGVTKDPAFHGFVWRVGSETQKRIMSEIRNRMADRTVRIQCDDIPGFPSQDITADLFDIDANLDKIYEDMQAAIEELRTTSSTDKDENHPLTRLLRAQQEIELKKIPLAVELGTDAIAKGFSVCFFCNFTQTVRELSSRMAAPFIDGGVTGDQRDRILAAFQSNESRALVLQSSVGGISIDLQDLDGEHPRMGYVFPPWSAVVFKQLCGRFRREGGKSKSHFRVLLAAGSDVERKIHRALQSKLNCLDSLNDGDLNPVNLKL